MDKTDITNIKKSLTSRESAILREIPNITIIELEHVFRAMLDSTGHDKYLLIGSQAILCHFAGKENRVFQFVRTMDIDIVPIIKFRGQYDATSLETLSRTITECHGEGSAFHLTFGYYVDVCDMETGTFFDRWEERLKMVKLSGVSVYLPSREDIAHAKYVAYREKDKQTIRQMWDSGFLKSEKMINLMSKHPNRKLDKSLNDEVIERIFCDVKLYHGYQNKNSLLEVNNAN